MDVFSVNYGNYPWALDVGEVVICFFCFYYCDAMVILCDKTSDCYCFDLLLEYVPLHSGSP